MVSVVSMVLIIQFEPCYYLWEKQTLYLGITAQEVLHFAPVCRTNWSITQLALPWRYKRAKWYCKASRKLMLVSSPVYKPNAQHDAVCENIRCLTALLGMVHRLPGKFGLHCFGARNLRAQKRMIEVVM